MALLMKSEVEMYLPLLTALITCSFIEDGILLATNTAVLLGFIKYNSEVVLVAYDAD